MKKLEVRVPHGLDPTEVRRRLDEALVKAREQPAEAVGEINAQWEDEDRLRFMLMVMGMKFDGQLEIQVEELLVQVELPGAAALFSSARVDPDEMLTAIRWAHITAGELIDPHTAIGLHAARTAGIDPAVPVVTLATAHPAKFRDAVEQATGLRPTLPGRVGDLFEREERLVDLPGDYAAIADYVAAHAAPKV